MTVILSDDNDDNGKGHDDGDRRCGQDPPAVL